MVGTLYAIYYVTYQRQFFLNPLKPNRVIGFTNLLTRVAKINIKRVFSFVEMIRDASHSITTLSTTRGTSRYVVLLEVCWTSGGSI